MNKMVLFLFHCIGVELLSYAAYSGVTDGLNDVYFTFTLISGLILFFGASAVASRAVNLTKNEWWMFFIQKVCELGLSLLPSGITLLKLNSPLAVVFLIIPVLSAVGFVKYCFVYKWLYFRDKK